jgi:multimeric flavodoxin WrbA
MGRSNVCVFGKYEGLYYIDWDNFSNQYENKYGQIITDYDFQREEWESSLAEFISDFREKFKTFVPCDKWINNNEKAVLENSLFYIVTQDNEWSMAIKLIQKEQDYHTNENIVVLQGRFYKTYLEGIKNCLFFFIEPGVHAPA